MPNSFIFLDKLPISSNGKVDRKNLPSPENEGNLHNENLYVAPQNDLQKTIAEILSQELELKTIGIAYSGLTDIEIAELTGHFLSRAIHQRGRYFEVEPDIVLEIAFDIIQPSDRHTSGLAMRFPRIVRIRADKSPAEIDTVQAAWQFVKKK